MYKIIRLIRDHNIPQIISTQIWVSYVKKASQFVYNYGKFIVMVLDAMQTCHRIIWYYKTLIYKIILLKIAKEV